MSRKSVQRFCGNDMRRNIDLKRERRALAASSHPRPTEKLTKTHPARETRAGCGSYQAIRGAERSCRSAGSDAAAYCRVRQRRRAKPGHRHC
ncbi:hypothetical protein ELH26_17460 [Rhizobium leguminosarum]|nr:hypothetical protein ELH26_17460 [Rhizobium leguminosarum]